MQVDANTTNIKDINFKEGAFLLIDKPYKWTSFDVVTKIRKYIKQNHNYKKIKVGHAGTLDPLATGLLIICTGQYTKKIDEFQNLKKGYTARIKFGETTPSYDRETEVNATFPVNHITQEHIKQIINKYTGEQAQYPPVYSAKKINGKRAYTKAREGEEVNVQPNQITIHEMNLLKYEFPYAEFQITCSKGTYIRSLARDIGTSLNTGATLDQLRRTEIGTYKAEDAIHIEDFKSAMENY